MTYLELAIAFTLKAEGKFVIDDGGPTMFGVTQHVYYAHRIANHELTRSVELIEPIEVHAIMFYEYWLPAHCDSMPEKLAIAMFDWSYNHGATGAIVTLQTCLGVANDGIWGPITATAIPRAATGLVARFLDARRAWYQAAAFENEEKYGKYLRGWLIRVTQLELYLESI